MTFLRKLAAAALIFILGMVVGYFLAGHRLHRTAANPPADSKLGPWQVVFKLPASFRVPLENPVLALDFTKHETGQPEFSDELRLAVTNLTSRTFTVQLSLYGYDSRGFRVGGDIERFSIRPNETLFKDLEISTYLAGKGTLGLPPTQLSSSYGLSVELGE